MVQHIRTGSDALTKPRQSTTPMPEMTGHTETAPLTPAAPMQPRTHVGAFVGRLLLAAIFLMAGGDKILRFADSQAHLDEAVQRAMAWYQCPSGYAESIMQALPWLLGIAAGVEIGGGLGLLLGWFTRCSAVTLFLFLIPTTIVFHGFWMYSDAERQLQMINFMKNLAIMGGLCVLASFGPGRVSVDAKACSACH